MKYVNKYAQKRIYYISINKNVNLQCEINSEIGFRKGITH